MTTQGPYTVRKGPIFFHLEGPTLPEPGFAFDFERSALDWSERLNAAHARGRADAGAEGARCRAACQAALGFIENLRVPQTINDAALQVMQGKPVIELLRLALSREGMVTT